MPIHEACSSDRAVRRASRPVPTISAWLWLYPLALSRPRTIQLSRRKTTIPTKVAAAKMPIASRDSYGYWRAKLVDITSRDSSPTPFAAATTSSRTRRNRWTSYRWTRRYDTSDRMMTIGRLPMHRSKSGWWLLTSGMPVSKRMRYAPSQAATVTTTSQTMNQTHSGWLLLLTITSVHGTTRMNRTCSTLAGTLSRRLRWCRDGGLRRFPWEKFRQSGGLCQRSPAVPRPIPARRRPPSE